MAHPLSSHLDWGSSYFEVEEIQQKCWMENRLEALCPPPPPRRQRGSAQQGLGDFDGSYSLDVSSRHIPARILWGAGKTHGYTQKQHENQHMKHGLYGICNGNLATSQS